MDWNRTLRKLHHKNSEPHREREGARPSAEAAMKSHSGCRAVFSEEIREKMFPAQEK